MTAPAGDERVIALTPRQVNQRMQHLARSAGLHQVNISSYGRSGAQRGRPSWRGGQIRPGILPEHHGSRAAASPSSPGARRGPRRRPSPSRRRTRDAASRHTASRRVSRSGCRSSRSSPRRSGRRRTGRASCPGVRTSSVPHFSFIHRRRQGTWSGSSGRSSCSGRTAMNRARTRPAQPGEPVKPQVAFPSSSSAPISRVRRSPYRVSRRGNLRQSRLAGSTTVETSSSTVAGAQARGKRTAATSRQRAQRHPTQQPSASPIGSP